MFEQRSSDSVELFFVSEGVLKRAHITPVDVFKRANIAPVDVFIRAARPRRFGNFERMPDRLKTELLISCTGSPLSKHDKDSCPDPVLQKICEFSVTITFGYAYVSLKF